MPRFQKFHVTSTAADSSPACGSAGLHAACHEDEGRRDGGAEEEVAGVPGGARPAVWVRERPPG